MIDSFLAWSKDASHNGKWYIAWGWGLGRSRGLEEAALDLEGRNKRKILQGEDGPARPSMA